MTRLTRAIVLGVGIALASLQSLWADVQPHALFSDGSVLQQGIKVPVWGTAEDGEAITVELVEPGGDAGAAKVLQTKKCTAAAKKWRVDLDPIPAGGPYELKISGNNSVIVHDVLVGEVWLASGQSNMQWAVAQSAEPDRIIATASEQPRMRLITIPRRAARDPETNVDAAWKMCTPDTVKDFSAVAYAFGRALHEARKVPVGMISTNFGGTPAESWTSREKLLESPVTAELVPAADGEINQNSGGGLYNAMIAPLVPYAVRGAIWYQGESNASRALQYRTLFPAMISDWRARWGQGDFPFLFVQLAPFQKIVFEPGDSAWAELRDAQRNTTVTLPQTAMAVITDLGDESDIHPKQKEPVGRRLALAARALAHQESVEYSGPVFKKASFAAGKATLEFDHVGGRLVAQGGALQGFTIAGADRKFVMAAAAIQGKTVVVHSDQVAEPVAVRFGWADYPVVNLWNQSGLPASPFRTDDFPLTTK